MEKLEAGETHSSRNSSISMNVLGDIGVFRYIYVHIWRCRHGYKRLVCAVASIASFVVAFPHTHSLPLSF